MLLLRILLFACGAFVVGRTLSSAIATFVLPRASTNLMASLVFRSVRVVFDFKTRKRKTYEERDAIMALYAPVTLFLLPVFWLTMVLLGYTAMFWALGVSPWETAFKISGSSALTLGFATGGSVVETILTFTEASIGLFLAAILIAYLPTMYSAWSKREAAVALFEVRAGSPPTALQLIQRFNRLNRLSALDEIWPDWEIWFMDIEESHTSLSMLSFFRSPQPDRSWVTMAGAILDAGALLSTTMDVPRLPQRELCLRAGYVCLRSIADFFGLQHDPETFPDDPENVNRISVTRREFDDVCDELAEQGVPMKTDRDAAWVAFAGWRVNYDQVLIGLAALTMAPYAPWSSDRSYRGNPFKLSGYWRTRLPAPLQRLVYGRS